MALDVGELYALFTLDSTSAESTLSGVGTSLTGIGNQIVQIGTLWQHAFTRPIINGMKDVVNTGMEFDETMAAVRAKSGIDINTTEGQEAFQALREEVLSVAQASVYTTAEMSGAYDKMAMAGWEWQSMVGGLEPIADLAAASGEGLVRVSDIVTDAMTAFGYTWESALNQTEGDTEDAIGVFQGMVEHFSDVLAVAATRSNTDVGMMGESFKYAASMAGSMGYSIDDVAVAFGLMANRGIKASQAGTSLRRVLSNLINPRGDDTVAAIEALGLSLDDGEGEMLSFMGVMQQLRESFSNVGIGFNELPEMDKALDHFNKSTKVQEYYDAIIEATETAKNDYQDYLDSLTEGELPTKELNDFQEAAEQALDPTLVSAYEKEVTILAQSIAELSSVNTPEALNIMQYASQIAGARGLPALLAIIASSEEEFNGLTEAIYNAEGATHQMKETALDSAKGDLDLLISNIDTLKQSIYSLISEDLRGLLQSTTEVIQNFISMDDETKTTIMQMIGMAAAIGPALIGIGSLLKLLPALGSAFSFLASPIGIVVAALGAFALNTMDSEGKISGAIDRMKKSLGNVGDAIGIEMPDLGFDFGEISLEDLIGSFLDSFTDFANSESVINFMNRLGNGLQGAIGKMEDINFSALLDKILGWTSDMSSSTAYEAFMSNLGNSLRAAGHAIGDITGEILKYITSVQGLQKILNAGLALGKVFIEGIWEGVWSFGEGITTGLLEALGLKDGVDFLSPSKKKELEAARDELISLAIPDTTSKDATAQGINAGLAYLGGFFDGLSDADISELYGGVNRITAEAWASSMSDAMEKAAASENPLQTFFETMSRTVNTAGGLPIRDLFPQYGEDINKFYSQLYAALQEIKNGEWYNASAITEALTGGEHFVRVDPTQQFRTMEESIALAYQAIEQEGKALGQSAASIEKEKENAKEAIEAYFAQLTEATALGAETAESTTEGVSQSVAETYNALIKPMLDSSEEAAKQSAETVAAIEGTFADGTDRVTEAAHTLEDAAVQEFLVNMSAENGTLIAMSFIEGLEAALADPDDLLSTAATTAADSVITTFQTILSAEAGTSIGSTFGDAVASAVADAADNVAQQVANMTASLKSAQDMVSSASRQMSAPSYYRGTPGMPSSGPSATAAAGNSTAKEIGDAVARGVANISVMMDGRAVGNLVTPTVSENIAANAAMRG